jgi:plasmid maintenance system killer protein
VHILFASTKLEKLLNSGKELRKTYGADCGDRIRRRLDDLHAAETLAVAKTLPQMRCHGLSGDRKGQIAADAKHPYRIVFEPADDPVPKTSDGGLDWARVRTIRILEVVDYHG